MQLTWYGHSTFRVEFGSTALLIDPFFTGNPSWGQGWEVPAKGVTYVLVTHGHEDHTGDAVAIAKATGATVVSTYEVCNHLAAQGVEHHEAGNPGGTIDCGSFSVSLVNALHSSSCSSATGEAVYLGSACGLMITASGEKTLYAMGDTGIFGDMALIDELFAPKVGLVPIGDRFTMGAKHAAMACKRYFTFDTIVPCHYGTNRHLDPSADRFLAEMGGEAGTVTVPEIGVAFEP